MQASGFIGIDTVGTGELGDTVQDLQGLGQGTIRSDQFQSGIVFAAGFEEAAVHFEIGPVLAALATVIATGFNWHAQDLGKLLGPLLGISLATATTLDPGPAEIISILHIAHEAVVFSEKWSLIYVVFVIVKQFFFSAIIQWATTLPVVLDLLAEYLAGSRLYTIIVWIEIELINGDVEVSIAIFGPQDLFGPPLKLFLVEFLLELFFRPCFKLLVQVLSESLCHSIIDRIVSALEEGYDFVDVVSILIPVIVEFSVVIIVIVLGVGQIHFKLKAYLHFLRSIAPGPCL